MAVVSGPSYANQSITPSQTYNQEDTSVNIGFESALPSEEAVLKALYTLGLTSYTNLKVIRERYLTKSGKGTPDFLEYEKAFKILSNPLVEAKYTLESFIYDFQLKAKDSKIESFDFFYSRLKTLTQNFRTESDKVYFFTDPQRVNLPGKKLYAKCFIDAMLKFNHAQTTYYMDASKTKCVLQRCKEELMSLDPARTLLTEEFKLVEAEESNLKNFEKMPSLAQAAARGVMAKKIK